MTSLSGHQREESRTAIVRLRLDRLVDVARRRARPWTEVSRPAPAGPAPAARPW